MWPTLAPEHGIVHPSISSRPFETSPMNERRSIKNPTCSIWAIDLSKRLPASAEIHAFDVSPALYPPVEWLPSNVSLHVHDAFTAFPEEIRGTYDVVHLRFFVTVVKDNDPGILLANIVKLLSERISPLTPITVSQFFHRTGNLPFDRAGWLLTMGRGESIGCYGCEGQAVN